MTALTFVSGLGADPERRRVPREALPPPRLAGLLATLLLVSLTGLPWNSAARLIPQADDDAEPFIGI